MTQKNTVHGWVNPDDSWTDFKTVRRKTTLDNMDFTPDNLPGGGLEIKIRNYKNGQIFAGPVRWTDQSKRHSATDVKTGTEFTIRARKLDESNADDFFRGIFYC